MHTVITSLTSLLGYQHPSILAPVSSITDMTSKARLIWEIKTCVLKTITAVLLSDRHKNKLWFFCNCRKFLWFETAWREPPPSTSFSCLERFLLCLHILSHWHAFITSRIGWNATCISAKLTYHIYHRWHLPDTDRHPYPHYILQLHPIHTDMTYSHQQWSPSAEVDMIHT